MKIDDALSTITHFFNDIIGAIVPGLVLFAGLMLLHNGIAQNAKIAALTSDTPSVLLVVVLSFAAGHGLLGIHSAIIEPALKLLGWVKGDAVINKVEEARSFKLFKKLVDAKLQRPAALPNHEAETKWGFHDLRNVALSMSTEATSLGRRFMFIALLCNGMGTALILLAFDFLACSLWWRGALLSYSTAPPYWLQFVGLIGLGLLCILRGDTFYRRAMSTPFSVATAELLMHEKADDAK